MMLRWNQCFLWGVALGSSVLLQAQVTFAPIFCDNMVLQQGKNLPVWGTAAPGEDVTVSFADQEVTVTSDKHGTWKAALTPLTASKENRQLKAVAKSGSAVVGNVLVGEVWLCSGQSNMEMPLWTERPRWRAADGDKEAKNCANPNIRIVKVRPHGWSITPNANFKIRWEALSPENAVSFSATAFFFGKELYKALDLPIGLITSHCSGTRIEPWIPAVGFSTVPQLKELNSFVMAKVPGTPEYNAAYQKAKSLYSDYLKSLELAWTQKKMLPQEPMFPPELKVIYDRLALQQSTVLYNRMIYPFVPFAFRGAIWYQGCSNLADGAFYRYKMQALLNGWRKVFNNPEMRFYFVQLAPFYYGVQRASKLPEIWEAQEAFANANGPSVGMAVINDVGNFSDIHPRDKATVGRRLALLALQRDYGKSDLVADSPILKKHEVKDGKFILDFDRVKKFEVKNGDPAGDFQLAGADGVFFPANVQLAGSRLIVSSDKVKKPRLLRYLWAQCVTGKIYNEGGLPLGAFRIEPTITPDEFLSFTEKNYQLLYAYDLIQRKYTKDNRQNAEKKFSRLLYLVRGETKIQEKYWVAVSCDAFTNDAMKLGIPTAGKGIKFQTKVNHLKVFGNVPGVQNGEFSYGNVEIWPNSYGKRNAAKIPGASDDRCDFGDEISAKEQGYGCMQIHNPQKKQTIFAYNAFGCGINADFGFGNAPTGEPDWTFSKGLKDYRQAEIQVYLLK